MSASNIALIPITSNGTPAFRFSIGEQENSLFFSASENVQLMFYRSHSIRIIAEVTEAGTG